MKISNRQTSDQTNEQANESAESAESAQYHEWLDDSLDEICRLQEAKAISAATAEALRDRESSLRHQIRLLRRAVGNARSDLESGLELAWGEFQRVLQKYAEGKG